MSGTRQHGGYSLAGGDSPFRRLFGAASDLARLPSQAVAPRPAVLTLTGTELRIGPFVLRQWGQLYVNTQTLSIDLDQLPAALFRIVAVHNFRVEDDNPRLNECVAGVFLARRIGERWEAAEDYPIECRSLGLLGYLDTETRRITPP